MENKPKVVNYHIVILILLLFIMSTGTTFAKTEVLRLEVTSDGRLDLKTNSKCIGSAVRQDYPEKGCLRANKGESLDITFRLVGNTKRGECSRNSSRHKYELSGIQLGGKNSEKPSDDEWENPTIPLDLIVQADFDVADAETGWLNVTLDDDEQGNNKRLRFSNGNKSLVGYSIWYRVRATCTDPNNPHEIFYDPRIDNLGNPPN